MISERDIAGQGRDAQIEAYKRERDGAVLKLSALRSMDPELRFVVRSNSPYTPDLMLGPTAADLVAEAEQNVADIDAAIAALEKLA